MREKLGLLLLTTSMLLVACGTVNNESVSDTENPDAEVTVEEVSEDLTLETEVWQETDEETGQEVEVTLVKHVKDGEVVRSSESREVIGGEEEVEDEIDVEADVEVIEITSEEDLEKYRQEGKVLDVEGDKVTVFDENGEVIEELTITEEGYQSTEEE